MKLFPAADAGLLIERMQSEGGMVQIGCAVTEDGYSVAAGFVGERPSVTWKIGSHTSPEFKSRFWSHYTAMYLLLRRRGEGRDCFDGIPTTRKIAWKDKDFAQALTAVMMGDPDIRMAK